MTAQHRMWSDILAQPESLAGVLRYQMGEGRPAMEQAAAALRDARRIVIAGMGASLFAAMPLGHHLNARGLACVVLEAGELLHFGGELARDAVVLLVSRSGETVEAVRLLPELREAGAVVIGVTNEPGTTLARDADITLLVNCGRDEAVAIQTYTGTLLATLLLGALVAGEDRTLEAAQAVDAVRGQIARYSQEPEQWAALLDAARVIYVLGRGPSLASAHEGALLFNEAAKLPSVCMPAGGFRHGPVEVVDSGFRAVLFASQAETAELDEALRASLVRMGGRAEMVVVTPGFFAPMVELIAVQFAAYRAAVGRGFTPGQFRYVSLVTTSETGFKTDFA